jgi:hypothetical protein
MKILNWLMAKKNTDKNDKVNATMENKNENEAICPNCQITLNKFPLRKTKCFNCGKTIYILKFNNYIEKKLVTKEEKDRQEIEENRVSFINSWLNELKTFGIKEEEFYIRKKELFLISGIENNDNDVIWSLFNELLVKNSNNYDRQSKLYHSMAIYLSQEGKDFYYLLRESYKANLKRMQLESLASNMVSIVEIVASTNSNSPACGKCKKLNGVQMTFEDALLKMPIPFEDCEHSNGFYRCFYSTINLRDENDMLMLK